MVTVVTVFRVPIPSPKVCIHKLFPFKLKAQKSHTYPKNCDNCDRDHFNRS